jgi:hypothetical protein
MFLTCSIQTVNCERVAGNTARKYALQTKCSNSNVYTGVDSVACIQLWSLHEQCHQLRGWGVVSLLYLLACALQYRYLNNKWAMPNHPTRSNLKQDTGLPTDRFGTQWSPAKPMKVLRSSP